MFSVNIQGVREAVRNREIFKIESSPGRESALSKLSVK